MEGLDLFTPVVEEESSEESSFSEMETDGGHSDSDFEVVTTRSKKKGLTIHISTQGAREKLDNDRMVDVVGDSDGRRDFEIEKVKRQRDRYLKEEVSCRSIAYNHFPPISLHISVYVQPWGVVLNC